MPVAGGARGIALLPFAFMLAACAGARVSAPPVADDAEFVPRVRIVHTNDFHGRLLPEPWPAATGAVGGSALLAAHIDSARSQFDGPTLVLSAGDDLQGTAISNLSWGRATIASHNALRYSAAALGNHEFDWGTDTLMARVRESRFPWLAANVVETATGRPPAWIRPWVLFDTLGVKVAVIGAALPATPEVVLADRIRGLSFAPAVPAIAQAAREARAAGAMFVVVTMHIGAGCGVSGTAPRERSVSCSGDAITIAEALAGHVDLIVAGHTHRRVLTTAGGVPVVEAASYSQAYSVTDLERRGGVVHAVDQRVEWVTADGVTPDTAVTRLVREWNERVRPVTEHVVAELGEALPRGDRDSQLGNLMADAIRSVTGAEVSLVNNGSIRRALPAGPLTFGVLYELQPFQNMLVSVEVPGRVVRAALEHALANTDGRLGVHVSGLRVELDSTAPPGRKVRRMVRASGAELGDDEVVRVGLTDFVAGGGDRFTMFAPYARRTTGVVDVDGLADYLRSLPSPVRMPRDARFVVSGAGGAVPR